MTGNPTSRGRLHGIALAAGLGLAALALQGVSAAPAGAATGATPVLRTHPMVRTSTAPGTANVGVTDFGWLSTNWSGYIVQGGTGAYTAITGCWTVPSVSPSAEPTFSSTWIGIDGATNADLIQTGTEQEYDGSAAYSAWWEILPAAQTTIPTMTVTPGDAMCAGISEGTGGNWTIAIQDVTTGHQFSTVEQYSGPQTSAEWIIERPEVCDPDCGLATLADYSPITIAPVSVNGANPDLTSADAGTMWNSAQTVQLSTPSNPNANTDGFAMAYGSTQPSPPASPSPTVSSLSPDVGPNAGGVWVTFAGTGIAPGATVTFGSSTSPEVTFTINSQLAALTPPGTGTVAVTITNPNAGSGTAPGAYTYSYDSAVAIRGADAGTWVLEGLDSASPVFAGSWTGQGGLALESPAVVSVPTGSGAGQPLYVVTGMDHNVYVSLPGGAWGALTAAPAYCTDAPAATVVAATPGSTSGVQAGGRLPRRGRRPLVDLGAGHGRDTSLRLHRLDLPRRPHRDRDERGAGGDRGPALQREHLLRQRAHLLRERHGRAGLGDHRGRGIGGLGHRGLGLQRPPGGGVLRGLGHRDQRLRLPGCGPGGVGGDHHRDRLGPAAGRRDRNRRPRDRPQPELLDDRG